MIEHNEDSANDWVSLCDEISDGQWFRQLLKELVEFERVCNEDLFQGVVPAIDSDEIPEWGLNSLLLGLGVDAEHTGFSKGKVLRARAFGKMVGTKWAYFDNASRNHTVFKTLNKRQVERIEKVWGEGFVSWLIEASGKCSTTYTPRMRGIQREALKQAEEQGLLDYVNFLQGLKQGMEFPAYAFRRALKPAGKREADANRRASVYILAGLLSQYIEEEKQEGTWGELTELFSKVTLHTLELETETVKKSLQKTGLKIGKVGRPSKRNRGV